MPPGKISRAEAETRALEFLAALGAQGWVLTVTPGGTVRLEPKRTRDNARG